jgi:hypothetical protein
MFSGAHVLFYTKDAEADRKYLVEVFGLRSIDIGHGWMIFALPPAEAAVHPAEDGEFRTEVYLMCDDLDALMKNLQAKKVKFGPVATERWGIRTTIELPSGAHIGVYQPTHPTALGLK